MKKILQYIPSFGVGGIESLVMALYNNINNEKYQIDFLVENEISSEIKDYIEKRNGKIFIIPFKEDKSKILSLKKYLFRLNNFFKKNKYDVFHCHVWHVRPFAIIFAKLCKIPLIITHAHAVDFNTNNKYIIKKMFQKLGVVISNCHLACSKEAGKSVFGKKKFIILNNGIDYDKYKYSKISREKIREKYLINKEEKVFINVGRLTKLKNQLFLIDVFNQILKTNKKSKLIICGNGDLLKKIYEKINEYGIKDKVIILTNIKDVSCFLSASDFFIFPSISEGLGIALLEAQANGLPCIVSDGIPKKALVNDNINVINLELNEEEWCNKINYFISKATRTDIINKKYDIKNITKKYQQLIDKGGKL